MVKSIHFPLPFAVCVGNQHEAGRNHRGSGMAGGAKGGTQVRPALTREPPFMTKPEGSWVNSHFHACRNPTGWPRTAQPRCLIVAAGSPVICIEGQSIAPRISRRSPARQAYSHWARWAGHTTPGRFAASAALSRARKTECVPRDISTGRLGFPGC